MFKKARQVRIMVREAVLGFAAFVIFSCASLDPGSIVQENGYHYGVGTGASAAEASAAAKRDLISNALSASRDRNGARAGRIEIGEEAALAFKLTGLTPYAQKNGVGSVSIAYRVKTSEWDTLEVKREAAARSEILPRIAALKAAAARPLSERMLDAGLLLDRLHREGLDELLTESGPGSPLVAATLESLCRELAAGVTVSVLPREGFVGEHSTFSVLVVDRDGTPLGSLPIRAEWTARDVEPFLVSATTGPDGTAALAYPSSEVFRNRAVRLTVSTSFSSTAPFSMGLKGMDAGSELLCRYRHFDDLKGYFSAEARVPGGSFTAGALPRDQRAAGREAPRAAKTVGFFIDRYPVTNALYAMFLEDTAVASPPEYWDNPEYNQDEQPVVGVSWEDANRFAAWLSKRLGVVKRLPTEDEWEKAARGGLDVIYPWGDQSPADGARANYDGNGLFTTPSPVGSYSAGRNAYGLFDMAGNVWQWTATPYEPGGEGAMIVKGGSWMDGPADLRVSSRRDLEPSKGYVDVGFRLVREVSND